MFDTEKEFGKALIERGIRSAFLDYLTEDAVLFRPNPVEGRVFWKVRGDTAPAMLIRRPTYADIASNGKLGYTTGNWVLYPTGRPDALTQFGQYVTIWEKKSDDKFHASVDIDITHKKLSDTEDDLVTLPLGQSRDPNKRGWSVADASMNFLKMSMEEQALGGAFERFADGDVRLLRDREPPVIGRKKVVKATRNFKSLSYPKKVAMLESADMAYVWNPCEFADSNEGIERGNCLQVWKLNDKRWWIVLSVFARVENSKHPSITAAEKRRESQLR